MSTKTTDQEISVSLEVIDSELSYTENMICSYSRRLIESRIWVSLELKNNNDNRVILQHFSKSARERERERERVGS